MPEERLKQKVEFGSRLQSIRGAADLKRERLQGKGVVMLQSLSKLRRGGVYAALALVLTLMLLCAPAAHAADKPDAKTLLFKAQEELSCFGFDNAAALFNSVIAQSTPGSDDWLKGTLGLAICLQQHSPPSPAMIERAAALLRSVIKAAPTSACAARATMSLARIEELSDYYGDEPRPEAARELYQNVVQTWPNEAIAGEATLRIAAIDVQTYEPEKVQRGVALLESWLASHPNDPLASVMFKYIGDTCYRPLRDYRKAVESYRKADAIGLLERGREGPVYWRTAVLAERELKDFPTAIEFYTKIIRITPTSGKAYEAQLALKRLGAPVPELRTLSHNDQRDASQGEAR